MIDVRNKSQCCGCTACRFVCPAKCITMQADGEGFEYPQIDTGRCTRCRRCEKVCPAFNQVKNQNAPNVYACCNRNTEIRKQSSSGGIFTLLAEQVLRQNGIVFGACFNERWEVVHRAVESAAQLEKLRGSKYVQSQLGDIFRQVKQSLDAGRKVLFSGTPCQVAGLKKGLNKNDPNLLMVDVVCHGVPSPLVFHLYRQAMEQRYHSPIRNFSFRDKTHGWENFHVKIELGTDTDLSSLWQNEFMRGFLSNVYLRPSCHACFCNDFRSGSDITLADYWGVDHVHPDFSDDQGTSLVLIHTPQGEGFWQNIEPMLVFVPSTLPKAISSNPCIVRSVGSHSKRRQFFDRIETMPILELIADVLQPDRSLYGRIKRFVRRLIVNRYTRYVYRTLCKKR